MDNKNEKGIEPCATSSEIDFAEWIKDNWIGATDGWHRRSDYRDQRTSKTLFEEYTIYKSQTPSPTGDRDCEELKKEVERLKGLIDAAKLALKEIYTGTDFPLSIAQNALQLLNKHP